ncbi:MAG: hypothetical protein ACRC3H_18395 [Lachnospiraceae bacterium]
MKTIKEFLNRDLSRSEKVLLLVSCFLTGIIVGFVFAPIKKGIYCGNHNVSKRYPDETTGEADE